MAEWFDDENFWKKLYPFLFAPEQFDKAEEEVEKILNLTSFRGDSVLDLCCGPGRHAVLLAKRGLSVIGVDKSKFLLRKARERSRKENVRVREATGHAPLLPSRELRTHPQHVYLVRIFRCPRGRSESSQQCLPEFKTRWNLHRGCRGQRNPGQDLSAHPFEGSLRRVSARRTARNRRRLVTDRERVDRHQGRNRIPV